MAKKSTGENISVKLQELANSAQIQIQKLANEATEKSFQYNSAEAATNRKWQEEMSNTSHQREVEDLKKAGLNPVLSANQGAMSYTSSSASAQANDPSSAVGSLLGNQMNNVAQIGMTKMNNAAQLKAAGAQAAAMKAAAAASAAATRYAADQQYAANKYAWDSKTSLVNKQIQLEKWKIKNAPQGSLAGLIDKHLGNTGIPTAVEKAVKGYFKGLTSKDIFKSFSSNNNFTLSKAGLIKVNNSLRSIGIPITAANQKMFIKGFVLGNSAARSSILSQRRMSTKW